MSADDLEKAFASSSRVLANVKTDQLDLSTPCASWKVRDVINHLVGGTTYFAMVAETGDAPQREETPPDMTVGEYKAAFDKGAERAVAAFRADGAMDKMMALPFGQLPGSVFVNIAAGDSFVHGWDLAKATGQPTGLDPALASQLLANAKAILQDSMRGEDGKAPFGPRVDVPESAAPADQLAGFLGRKL